MSAGLGEVERWDDTLIDPGSNWREEIKVAIESAKVAILIVSADFLASDFIVNNEIPLKMHCAADNDYDRIVYQERSIIR